MDVFLLLFVAHAVHDDKDGIEVIRIISARRANLKERKRYKEESSLLDDAFWKNAVLNPLYKPTKTVANCACGFRHVSVA